MKKSTNRRGRRPVLSSLRKITEILRQVTAEKEVEAEFLVCFGKKYCFDMM